MEKILVICGPTSTGKTSLALNVAKIIGKASIISADSRQIYQGIDIISGRDLPKDLAPSIELFGLDLFSPDQIANISQYINLGRNKINQDLKKGLPVIIVGGTGFYIKGLTQDLPDISIPNDEILRQSLESLSVSQLQEKLSAVDSLKFVGMNNSDKNNPRRLIRAIEVALAKNQSPRHSGLDPESIPVNPLSDVEFIWVGLLPKNNISELIKKRVEERIKSGAIDEVKRLIANYPNLKLPIYSSLGVKEIIDFIDGKSDLEGLVDSWTKSEVAYSKRQMVWFKKQPNIIWYDETVDRGELANKLSSNFN